MPKGIGAAEGATAGGRTGDAEAEAPGPPDPDTQSDVTDPHRQGPYAVRDWTQVAGRRDRWQKTISVAGYWRRTAGPSRRREPADLAGGQDTRRDSLEAAIDDVEARLGKDAVQSGRVFSRKHRPERDPTRRRASLDALEGDDDGDTG